MLLSARVLPQIFRYFIVGVLNNLLGYLIYLTVTWLWLEPKLAVTLLYPIGVLTAYYGHAEYSFSYRGRTRQGLSRYLIAHLAGYGANLLLLYICVDIIGLPHQIVQAAAILLVAGILFLLFRYYVFPVQPIRTREKEDAARTVQTTGS